MERPNHLFIGYLTHRISMSVITSNSSVYLLIHSFKSPSPPRPPPQSAQQGNHVNSSPNLDLIPALSTLTLSGGGNQPEPRFVGGFHPQSGPSTRTNTQHHAAASHTPPFNLSMPIPPSMLTPEVLTKRQQSLTMQMALRPSEDEAVFPHRYTLPPRTQTVFPVPITVPFSAPRPAPTNLHIAPTKPQRPRAASTPATSSLSSTSERCAGVTKAGQQCSRLVKLGPALSALSDSGDGDSPSIERFCFQHTKEVLTPSGYYSRKTGAWIEFIGKFIIGEARVSF
jgi:hypothetical protein